MSEQERGGLITRTENPLPTISANDVSTPPVGTVSRRKKIGCGIRSALALALVAGTAFLAKSSESMSNKLGNLKDIYHFFNPRECTPVSSATPCNSTEVANLLECIGPYSGKDTRAEVSAVNILNKCGDSTVGTEFVCNAPQDTRVSVNFGKAYSCPSNISMEQLSQLVRSAFSEESTRNLENYPYPPDTAAHHLNSMLNRGVNIDGQDRSGEDITQMCARVITEENLPEPDSSRPDNVVNQVFDRCIAPVVFNEDDLRGIVNELVNSDITITDEERNDKLATLNYLLDTNSVSKNGNPAADICRGFLSRIMSERNFNEAVIYANDRNNPTILTLDRCFPNPDDNPLIA